MSTPLTQIAGRREAAALLALCAVAYLPAALSFFVKDDIALVTSARLDLAAALHHSWPEGFFRPAAELLFAAQHSLFGFSPLPYHLLSFAAHLAATFCAYRLFNLLPSYRPVAFLATALCALHPINTETVSWIAGQMSLFSALCTLAVLYLLRTARPPAALVAVFVLGLGFYENFLLVVLLGGLLYSCDDRFRAALRPANLLAVCLCSAIYLYWRFAALNLDGGYYQPAFSLQNGAVNLVYYLYLLAGGSAIGGRILRYRPEALGDYFFDVFTPLLLLNALLGLAGLWLACRHRDRPSRDALLPLAWIVLALLPTLLLPERPRRLAYIAVPGYALSLGQILRYIHAKTRPGPLVARTGCIFYALLLVATLYLRNGDWRTAGALERTLPEVVATDCREMAFDVPNLLGDALFFNSISASLWLGSHTPDPGPKVYATAELERMQTAPDCYYRFVDGAIRPVADTDPTPLFIRGRNWSRIR